VLALHEGQRIPDTHLPTLGGEWTRISSIVTRPTLFYLWATWEKHRETLGVLEEYFQKHRSVLNIVGIAYDVQSHSVPMRYVRRYKVTFPVLLDNYCHLSRVWGVKKVPISLLVDADCFIERIEREPKKSFLNRAVASDVSVKRTRVLEPTNIAPGDARVESLLQETTNLLGRNRSKDALDALKRAAKLAPDNEIIAAQVDVLQNPKKYYED
jgi:peroxiredoxin